MLHFILIYNPVAGRGKGLAKAQRLAYLLRQRQHKIDLFPTHPDPEIFREQCRDFDSQAFGVVIGGDGTLRLFVQCMPKMAGLAFYGMGTANVLRIEFGLPKELSAFVTMLEHGKRTILRPGLADGERLFMMMYSFGRDSYVLANASQSIKNVFGKLAFTWPAIKSIFCYRAPPQQLILDDNPPITAHFAIISRIRHYAGAFLIGPDADPTSDYFQVIALKRHGFMPFLCFCMRVVFARLRSNPHVTITTAKTIRFPKLAKEIYAQIDGDPLTKPIENLTVSSQEIPFLIP